MLVPVFSFWGNPHFLHCGFTTVHSHPHCLPVSFSLHLWQRFLLTVFWILASWQVWGSIHCGLDFQIPDDEMLSIFHVSIGHQYLFFGEMSIQCFSPSLNRVMGLFCNTFYESFSYFGCLPLFRYILLAHIFSHSTGCLLVFLTVSHALSKLFSLLNCHLFLFAFVAPAWEDRSKKLFLRPMSKCILSVFF